MKSDYSYSDSQQRNIGILFILYGLLILILAILSTVKAITGKVYSPSLCFYLPITIGLLIWLPLVAWLHGKARIAALLLVSFIVSCLLIGAELQLAHILLMIFLSLPCWLILIHTPELPFLHLPATLLAGSCILFSIILFSLLEHNLHPIFRVLFRFCDLTEIVAGGLLIDRSWKWLAGIYPTETENDFPEEQEEEVTEVHSGAS